MLVIRQRFTNLAKNRFGERDSSFFPDLVRISRRIPTGDGLDWEYWGVCAIALGRSGVGNAESQRTQSYWETFFWASAP